QAEEVDGLHALHPTGCPREPASAIGTALSRPYAGAMEPTERPRWRGVNHLALITGDMDATVRFYHGVLGARLVATIGTPHFRHYFFEIGPGHTVAFFEYAGHRPAAFAKPAGVPDPRAVQFDHLALDVA